MVLSFIPLIVILNTFLCLLTICVVSSKKCLSNYWPFFNVLGFSSVPELVKSCSHNSYCIKLFKKLQRSVSTPKPPTCNYGPPQMEWAGVPSVDIVEGEVPRNT